MASLWCLKFFIDFLLSFSHHKIFHVAFFFSLFLLACVGGMIHPLLLPFHLTVLWVLLRCLVAQGILHVPHDLRLHLHMGSPSGLEWVTVLTSNGNRPQTRKENRCNVEETWRQRETGR